MKEIYRGMENGPTAINDNFKELEKTVTKAKSDLNTALGNIPISASGSDALVSTTGAFEITASNYTDWTSTGVAGVFYKRQGNIVFLKANVSVRANAVFGLGSVPRDLIPGEMMLRATAWTVDGSIGRNIQIQSDGSMSLLANNRADKYEFQLSWCI